MEFICNIPMIINNTTTMKDISAHNMNLTGNMDVCGSVIFSENVFVQQTSNYDWGSLDENTNINIDNLNVHGNAYTNITLESSFNNFDSLNISNLDVSNLDVSNLIVSDITMESNLEVYDLSNTSLDVSGIINIQGTLTVDDVSMDSLIVDNVSTNSLIVADVSMNSLLVDTVVSNTLIIDHIECENVSANSFLSLHQLDGFPENTASLIEMLDEFGERILSEYLDEDGELFIPSMGGVLAPNGKIYFIPGAEKDFLFILDPTTNITNTISISIPTSSFTTQSFLGGVLAPNGKIYCIPGSSQSVLIIDPTTNDTSYISGLGQTFFKWAGGVLAPNGKIYGIPFNSSSVLIIDPTTNNISYISGLSGGNKWSGGVLAPNGKIYGIPAKSTSVLIIDPTTNTADITTITGLSDGGSTSKWSGGVLAPNGKIYGIPSNTESVLIIDPTTNTADITTITGLSDKQSKWSGGVLAPNGKIYGIPYDTLYDITSKFTTSVLIIDPTTNNISYISGLGDEDEQYVGGVLAPNGNIYGIPYRSNSILEIKTGLPVHPPWMLQAYFNKF